MARCPWIGAALLGLTLWSRPSLAEPPPLPAPFQAPLLAPFQAQATPDNGTGPETPVPARIELIYLAVDGAPRGPLDAAAVDALIAADKLLATSLVWYEGQAGWAPLKEVEALKDVLQRVYAHGSVVAQAFLLGAWGSDQFSRTLESYGATMYTDSFVAHEDGTYSRIATWIGLNPARPMTRRLVYEGTYQAFRGDAGEMIVSYVGTTTDHDSEAKKPTVWKDHKWAAYLDKIDQNTLFNDESGAVYHRR